MSRESYVLQSAGVAKAIEAVFGTTIAPDFFQGEYCLVAYGYDGPCDATFVQVFPDVDGYEQPKEWATRSIMGKKVEPRYIEVFLEEIQGLEPEIGEYQF